MILLLGLLCFAVSGHTQEILKTDVVVTSDQGYGRLAIALPDRTKFLKYTLQNEDNVLVIDFAERIDIDLDDAQSELRNYVIAARLDPDGLSVRFALADGVKANALTAGEHFFLDFLPREWQGEPPAIPQRIVRKLEKRAEEALERAAQNAVLREEKGIVPKLSVRVGRHPTFTRFVFTWNVPYTPSFKRENKLAILNFDKRGNFDFAPINADLPPLVRRIDGEKNSRSTIVKMLLDDGARVRSYVDGEEYIVDVTSDALASKNDKSVSLPFVIGGLPEVPDDATGVIQTLETEETRKVAEAPKVPEPTREREQPDTPKPPKAEAKADEADDTPLVDASEKEAEEPREDNPEFITKKDRRIQGVSTTEVLLNAAKDSVRLKFPFHQPTASAVFRRDKAIWIVFKTDDFLDIAALRSEVGTYIRTVQLIDQDDFKAVRIGFGTAQLASAAIEGNNWTITVGSSVVRAPDPLVIARDIDPNGAMFLKVSLSDGKGSVVLADPVVKDQITTVVALPPTRGLLRAQTFVPLTTLPSTHGVAYIANVDNLSVGLAKDYVRIFSDRILNLSPTRKLRETASSPLKSEEWYDAPLDLTDKKSSSPAAFNLRERELINKVVSSKKAARAQAGVDLATFYIANHYGAEAIAQLKEALKAQPLLINKRLFVLAKAAAALAMDRNKDAFRTLSGEAYKKDQDAAVWRTVAASALGNWQEAMRSANLGRTRASTYPAIVQQRFNLAAADAALHLKDTSGAKNYLSNLVLRDAAPLQRGRYEILQAELATVEGRLEDARFFWERASKIEDVRVQADAKLGLLEHAHKTNANSNEKTIDELERFVSVWRNDDIELRALRALGRVLVKEENYRRAFELVQVANLSDAKSAITQQIQDDMTEVFIDLFHQGKAEAMDPVDALSLYYDFRNLTPIGRVGDEIVRYLSRRLIDLDLLAQASDLLTHQVDKRLDGAARARVAADLAVVHLLDNKPHLAITTLNKSRSANLPASLERQRRLVEAYALAEVGKYDLALSLLQPLDGEDVERLRATISWTARRWSDAGSLLEAAHSNRWSDGQPLEPHVRLDIMRAAIAYTLAKDNLALKGLNQKFRAQMANSQDADAFAILTRPLSDQSFERDVAIDSILNIGTQYSFLRDYRRQYLTTSIRKPDTTRRQNS